MIYLTEFCSCFATVTRRFAGNTTRRLILYSILLISLVPVIVTSAQFQVNTTSDGPPFSLRWCIQMANQQPGLDTITFNLMGSPPFILQPLSQLPQITDQMGVLIDGLSATGASPGTAPPSTATLSAVIDGSFAGASHGFWIVSSNNIIRGLVIRNFQQDGIRIEGIPQHTAFNLAYCNFVGTDQTGTIASGNGLSKGSPWGGISIVVTPGSNGFAHHNIVRGNLCSSNYAEGVTISSCPPGDVYLNLVDCNYIGTNKAGTQALGNKVTGVYIGEAAHDNTVTENVISGNDTNGVCIIGYVDAQVQWYTRHNHIVHNRIGVAADWVTPIPNAWHGISIGIYASVWMLGFADYNDVTNNTIAFNGRKGVLVFEHQQNTTNGDYNTITQNSIHHNGLLGIDLGDNGVTTNDNGDPDTGPNQELNMPVITSATFYNGIGTVSGTVDIDTPPVNATVEIFKASCDASGYGEGAIYLGTAKPLANGTWSCTFPGGLTLGDSVTATVTDTVGNTSEFAQILQTIIPIELQSFSASVTEGNVLLHWTTATETNNAGFEVQRRISNGVWEIIGFVSGHGTTNETHMYLYYDGFDVQKRPAFISYKLRQMDFDGKSTFSPVVTAPLGEWSDRPFISECYPNPFQHSTTIRFHLNHAAFVKLTVYDLYGRETTTLTNDEFGSGVHQVPWYVDGLPGGMYRYQMQVGEIIESGHLVVLK